MLVTLAARPVGVFYVLALDLSGGESHGKFDRTLATTRNEVHHSAVTGSVNILSAQDRATVVMACGTGKTLVELGLAEKVL
jgi:superfamily II DNA or RNA helicase